MARVEKQKAAIRDVRLTALQERAGESEDVVEVPKMVKEYPMPGARQTHEMVFLEDTNTLFISQQTNSTLLMLRIDTCATFTPLSCKSFIVGDFWAGLHGLTPSKAYASCFWATLQFKSLLLRFHVDPAQTSDPSIEQVIVLPTSVNGPHVVIESGDNVWTSCKDSSHVVRVNHTKDSDVSVYPCSRRPIFIAVHPTSGDTYASLDISSKIWRLVVSDGLSTETDIPASLGNTPVGLVAAPDGNLWFTLLGDASGGNGTFARISAEGQFTWLRLTNSIGSIAGLIHLAFDWSTTPDQNGDMLTIWLLASSLGAGSKGVDAVLSVVVNTAEDQIKTQLTTMFPTQLSYSHRVLPLGSNKGLFVTLLGVSTLAHVMGPAVLQPSSKPFLTTGETTDFFADFGQGIPLGDYSFSQTASLLRLEPARKKRALPK